MFNLGRRPFLAALAATMAGLGLRRAAAVPAHPEPVSVPPEVTPAVMDAEAAGWWVENSHLAYHPEIGWLHTFRAMFHDVKRAEWYGPPPPINWPHPPALRIPVADDTGPSDSIFSPANMKEARDTQLRQWRAERAERLRQNPPPPSAIRARIAVGDKVRERMRS